MPTHRAMLHGPGRGSAWPLGSKGPEADFSKPLQGDAGRPGRRGPPGENGAKGSKASVPGGSLLSCPPPQCWPASPSPLPGHGAHGTPRQMRSHLKRGESPLGAGPPHGQPHSGQGSPSGAVSSPQGYQGNNGSPGSPGVKGAKGGPGPRGPKGEPVSSHRLQALLQPGGGQCPLGPAPPRLALLQGRLRAPRSGPLSPRPPASAVRLLIPGSRHEAGPPTMGLRAQPHSCRTPSGSDVTPPCPAGRPSGLHPDPGSPSVGPTQRPHPAIPRCPAAGWVGPSPRLTLKGAACRGLIRKGTG